MKSIYRIVSRFLFILLLLTFLVSIGRTLLNVSKAYFERDWLAYSDNQKREKFFGDYYSFLQFIERNTNSRAHIILLTSYPDLHYLGKYFLYPRIVIDRPIPDSIRCNDYMPDFEYLAVYKNVKNKVVFDCVGFNKVAEYIGKVDTARVGYLLKL